MRNRLHLLAEYRAAIVLLAFTVAAGMGRAATAIEEEELTEVGTAIQAANGTRLSVKLQDVRFGTDGSVRGELVNQSSDLVREVRLLVRYDWRWGDERNPGEDSPGRSLFVTIPGDLPALGTLPFEYTPDPPLPPRSDGTFSPSVEVAGYTEVRFKKVIRRSR